MEVTIKANDEHISSAVGYLFYIVSSNGELDIELINHDQSVIEAREGIKEGQGLGDKRPVRFEYVRFINRNAFDVTVDFYAGNLGMFDNRNVGEVVVTNLPASSRAATDSGAQFVGPLYQAATSSKYSTVQVFNPVASGIDVYINRLVSVNDVQGTMQLRHYDTPLTTLYSHAKSKKDGAGGITELRRNAEADNALGTVAGRMTMGANRPFEWVERAPIKLAPGEGVIVTCTNTNTTLEVYVDLEEVAI